MENKHYISLNITNKDFKLNFQLNSIYSSSMGLLWIY